MQTTKINCELTIDKNPNIVIARKVKSGVGVVIVGEPIRRPILITFPTMIEE